MSYRACLPPTERNGRGSLLPETWYAESMPAHWYKGVSSPYTRPEHQVLPYLPSGQRSNPQEREGELELRRLLREALPRCAMSFVFEITGFTCFVAIFFMQVSGAFLSMGLGAFCLWQAHGLMRSVSGSLGEILQLHTSFPALKTRYGGLTAFVHRYARLTGHAPQP